MNMISEKEVFNLRKKFNRAKPFKHILLENFLEEKKAKKLRKALKEEKFEEKDSDLFHFFQTADFENIVEKELRDFYSFLKSEKFADFIKKITRIHVSSGALDVSASLYENTGYLLCHDDRVEDRKIAYILYLSEDFHDKDGGALAFLADNRGKPGKVIKRYLPKWNSLMIFEVSKKSWHQVEEVLSDRKRYAIGGWLR